MNSRSTTLASLENWHIHQIDVNSGFLHRDLQEDVYISIHDRILAKINQVCKLEKNLYGLKQASRKLYEKMSHLLIHEGYHQSTSDYSLFIIKHEGNFTTLLVYLVDIIIDYTSLAQFTGIKGIMYKSFKIKDLGILKYFLGL